MTLNIALLGAGRIGRVHAGAIESAKGARVSSVSDPLADSAQALASTLGCPTLSTEEAIASSATDAVLIATSTDTHADLIEAAARAGKAIFCEKPVDLDSDRVKACLAVVAENHSRLMVGFNRRFDPHFASLRKAVNKGAIGQIEQVQIISRDPEPPPMDYIARSGGLFRDMMIHDFDLARFLLDEEFATVIATGSVLVDPAIGKAGDIDTATALLTTATGKQCVITNSRRATYGYDQRVEIHGSLGMAQADNPRIDSVEIAAKTGYSRGPLHHFFMTRYIQAYADEINQFIKWIGGSDVAVPTGEDGLKALQLADAAVSSMTSGTTVNLA